VGKAQAHLEGCTAALHQNLRVRGTICCTATSLIAHVALGTILGACNLLDVSAGATGCPRLVSPMLLFDHMCHCREGHGIPLFKCLDLYVTQSRPDLIIADAVTWVGISGR
jgi:hypothetical protein